MFFLDFGYSYQVLAVQSINLIDKVVASSSNAAPRRGNGYVYITLQVAMTRITTRVDQDVM
jgi:hypothetical protein